MKNYITLLFLLVFSITSHAQTDKEDAKDQKADRKQEIRDNAAEHKSQSKLKVDYNLFRRQMLATKEYADERKKIPALQKASKMTVKIVVYIDSVDAEDSAKTLLGYITENVGDNSTNIYEASYDRAQKKITSVKPTGETSEIEQDDADVKKPAAKKTTAKKSKGDDDDDDDADQDKPAKKNPKDEE